MHHVHVGSPDIVLSHSSLRFNRLYNLKPSVCLSVYLSACIGHIFIKASLISSFCTSFMNKLVPATSLLYLVIAIKMIILATTPAMITARRTRSTTTYNLQLALQQPTSYNNLRYVVWEGVIVREVIVQGGDFLGVIVQGYCPVTEYMTC